MIYLFVKKFIYIFLCSLMLTGQLIIICECGAHSLIVGFQNMFIKDEQIIDLC